MFGGLTVHYELSSSIAAISKYSPETDTWIEVREMPRKLYAHNAEAIGRIVYLIGGNSYPDTNYPNRITVFEISDISLDATIHDDTIRGDSIQIDLLQHSDRYKDFGRNRQSIYPG